jgi:hypothetical protein
MPEDLHGVLKDHAKFTAVFKAWIEGLADASAMVADVKD